VRRLRKTAILLTTTAGILALAMVTTQACSATTARRTLTGAAIQRTAGQTYVQALAKADADLGHLGVVRYFDPNTPNSWASITHDVGQRPVVASFKMPPTDVLNGQYDATLRAWFNGAPTDRRTFWSYLAEPEDDIANGAYTAKQFRNAWVHIEKLAAATHNAQIRSTLTLMCYTLSRYSHRNWQDYYPGAAYVDVLGWDCYNWGAKKGNYAAPADIFAAAIQVSDEAGKPFGIAETGSVLIGSDGSRRAAWLRDMGSYLKAEGAVFVCYFNVDIGVDYRLRDLPSQAAWRHVNAS
jgi:Glycosyl hydrolase family 26